VRWHHRPDEQEPSRIVDIVHVADMTALERLNMTRNDVDRIAMNTQESVEHLWNTMSESA
jgi:hypothetical protein